METIAFKSTWKHASLEYLIKEIDNNQDLSRSAITIRAIDSAEKVEDWRKVKEGLSLLKKIDDVSISTASSMQAKIDEQSSEKVKAIRNKMFFDLKKEIPELKRLQTPYFMLLLWLNYLNQLKAHRIVVGKNISPSDLTGPDMVKRLVQILLLNRDSDREVIENIKKELTKWEE